MKSDLLWIIKIPTPSCPKCSKEGIETIAGLVNRDEIACVSCGTLIDLTSEEWRAYIQKAQDAVSELAVIYRELP